MSTLIYIALALLLLGLLVTVHEWGHFIASRLCGIEVAEFSIGMGPLLWKKKGKRGTQYSLRAIPIGGFCRYYDDGEDDDPSADAQAINPALAYNNQPVWKRAIATVCGPLMNFIIAFLIIFFIALFVGQQVTINQIGEIEAGMPAQSAGLQVGDILVAVDGTRTENTEEISALIAQAKDAPVTVSVQRGEEEMDFTLTPQFDAETNRHRIGIAYGVAERKLSLAESALVSVRWNVGVVQSVLDTLKRLITRGEGVGDLSGPVGTVYIIQEATRQGGIETYLLLAALISVNLGFMNLLPIPGLDGSRLIFLLIEAIRRKPVKREIEGRIYMAGFALLMLLMLVLTYQDIVRIFA